MPRVLVAGKLHPSGIALLDQAEGVTYDYVEDISEESYAPLIGKADGLVIRTQPMSAATIANGENLRIVSRHGVGFDAVDVAALNARNIPLAIVGDVNSRAVAEHTMTLLLAAAKRVLRYDAACRGERPWGYRNSLEAQEVYDKELLIVGYGRIGRHLAKMATAFGIRISIFDPFLPQGADLTGVKRRTDLAHALQQADFISLHVPNTGKPILGAKEINQLKPNAIVLNSARGGLIDDAALAEALRHGRIQGAGIDVFPEEPPAPDHVYADIDTAVLSPHSAGMSLECAERMAVVSVQNVLDFFNGTLDCALVVNRNEIRF
ncbi:MAG: hydroxyacid dehydrogenase [Rhodobacteraceae bacterium]|nr:hydroxyacid dehydrogenase [Paracoccaceae bacterium]